MALIACHECKNQVSTEAATCPSCGAKPRPTAANASGMDAGSQAAVIIVLVIVAAFGIAAIFGDSKSESEAKAAACKADLSCWGKLHAVTATVICTPAIEMQAKYSARWTDDTFEPKFSRYRWIDAKSGTLAMIGDRVEFQNGFGAYSPMTYRCDIDPATEKVLGVQIIEGRLPR